MKKGHIAGVLFALIFGFSFMFSKIVLAKIPPMGLIAYRFLLAWLVFELLRQCRLVRIRFRKELFLPVFLVSLFQPILYFIFESYGLNLTSSAEAGMMIALIPIFVAIMSSLILNEKPNRLQVLFIILSVSGILLIQLFKTGFRLDTNFTGFALLFLAVVCAALFNIASRSASKKVKPFELTYFMMLSGALVFNLIYVFQLVGTETLKDYFLIFSDIEFIAAIAYLGVVASIGGFFLVNYALSILPAHVSSIYANLSTVVAVIAGYLFLQEAIFWYHIVGGLMIIGGVYGTAMVNVLRQRKGRLVK